MAFGVAAAAMVPGYATLDDPQMRARGFFERIDNPLVGEQEYPTWPVRLSGGPERVWTGPAPTSASTPPKCCRVSWGSTMPSSRDWSPST